MPTLAELRVMRAMHPGLLACAPGSSLREVAALMATHGTHCVVVYRGSRRRVPWGIISDLDLMAAVRGGDPDGQAAESVAASPVVFVSSDDTLERAAQLMVEHSTAHLIVRDADTTHPIGVVSTLDVAAALADVQVRSGPPRKLRRH